MFYFIFIRRRTRISLASVDAASEVTGADLNVAIKVCPVAVPTGTEGPGDDGHRGPGQDLSQTTISGSVSPAGDRAQFRQLGVLGRLGDAQRLNLWTLAKM